MITWDFPKKTEKCIDSLARKTITYPEISAICLNAENTLMPYPIWCIWGWADSRSCGWIRIILLLFCFVTDSEPGWTCLEYFGRFQNELGHVIIASGHTEKDCGQSKERVFKHRTLLFQIDGSGNCSMSREWEIQLSSANSIVVQNPFAFFGQNKMVTRLNLATGDLVYLTNKTEVEQAALFNELDS